MFGLPESFQIVDEIVKVRHPAGKGIVASLTKYLGASEVVLLRRLVRHFFS